MMKRKKNKQVDCIVCGIKMNSLHDNSYEMVDGGIVDKIIAPYGSRFDGDVLKIGICDNCVEKSISDGKITVVRNSIFGDY